MQRSAGRAALRASSLLALLLHGALSCGAPDLLLCRSCGHEVAPETDLTSVISPLTLSYRNATLAGGRKAVVQLLENPQGFRFEVIAAKKADVMKHWPADAHFTWFPGFSWTVATCPRCKAHLGWAFQPSTWPQTVTREEFEDSPQTFVVLIVDRLLQEQFASTLLLPLKSFKS